MSFKDFLDLSTSRIINGEKYIIKPSKSYPFPKYQLLKISGAEITRQEETLEPST